MLRGLVTGLGVLLVLALGGCGLTGNLVVPEGQAETAGLFAPKLPADRVLSAEDRQGDFDRFLVVATRDALTWSPKAQLTGAHATNVDAQGGKAGGTTYVYAFASGKDGLAVTITANAVTFAKAKAGSPLETRGLVPASMAMAAALDLGTLASESYVLQLGTAQAGPVYVIREFKREGAASVTIDARSGAAIR